MLHCLPAAPVAGAPARTCAASRSAPGALSGPTCLWWSGRFARRQCPAGVLSICIATVWHRLVRVGRQRRGGRAGLLRVIFEPRAGPRSTIKPLARTYAEARPPYGDRASGLRGSAVGDEAGGAPVAALDDRLRGAGGVDDLAVAGVDRDVAGPGDDVTGLGLRLGDRATAVGDLAAGARHVDAGGLVGVVDQA